MLHFTFIGTLMLFPVWIGKQYPEKLSVVGLQVTKSF